jgi:demethylmacrocin O-methyltransferase
LVTTDSLDRLRNYLKPKFDEQQRQRLRRLQTLRFRGLQHYVFRALFGRNLRALALLNGTDKWGNHWYARHYETHFAPLRLKRLKILEIGIGGYEDPEAGGASLRMWRTYFPRSTIFGIDIYEKSLHDERRIKTFRGSQVDEHFLRTVLHEIGPVDIIIDDGSHINEHVIRTFELLFPHLRDAGMYVIEDTQTSYWSSAGGSSKELNSTTTTMGFLKKLIDGLNHAEFEHDYEPTFYDKNVVAMYFYHNLVFIRKGPNTEEAGRGAFQARGSPISRTEP